MSKRKYLCPDCGKELKTKVDSLTLPWFFREFTSRRLLRQLYGLCKSCRKLIIWDKKGRVVALYLPLTPSEKKEAEGEK